MTKPATAIAQAWQQAYDARRQGRTETDAERAQRLADDPDVMRDRKSERVAAELERDAQAGEAAAAISEAVAPDTSDAHQEVQLDAEAAMRALLDCFPGEELSYLRSNLIDRIAYRAHRMIAVKDKQIDEAGEQLAYLRRRNKGGEIDDQKVIRKLDWLRGIEFEQEAWADLLTAAERVYDRETGDVWYPATSTARPPIARRRPRPTRRPTRHWPAWPRARPLARSDPRPLRAVRPEHVGKLLTPEAGCAQPNKMPPAGKRGDLRRPC